MHISLASTTFDIYGYIEIDTLPDDTDGTVRRRNNRTQTLDGGYAISDRGYSDSDRTPTYRWQTVSAEHNELISRLVKLYSRIWVATRTGFYLAAPGLFTPGTGESSLEILILEKLSE